MPSYSRSFSSAVCFLFALLPAVVLAGNSCIAFDASFNLLAFNLNGKDYNAGTQDKWSSGSASEISASGRPPFSGSNVTCYLSQFSNAIYVMGADSSNPTNIAIYDAAGSKWSTQSVSGASGFDPASVDAILDHDTNVFYALSKGELFSLAMGDGTLNAASSNALSWQDVSKPIFDTTNYSPVMALAENHIHFLNVPNVPGGSANIFVIHFSFWQPDVQKYGDFPAQPGQAASIFLTEGVQKEFVYVPNDGSQTYVINVDSNSTKTLSGPPVKDPLATYFGATNSIVQLTSNGAVNFLNYDPNSSSTSSSWNSVQALTSVAPPSSNSTTPGASGSGSPSGTAKGSSPSSGSGGSSNPNGSALTLELSKSVWAALFLCANALLVLL